MTSLDPPRPPAEGALAPDVRTISLVSLAHAGSHFCQLMVPPLFPWIGAAFGLSHTQLGVLLSVFFVVSGFGQAGAGFVVDRHGAGRVLFGGLALLALAALGLAASASYAALLAFMAVAGLGNCVFHPVDYSILNARVRPLRLGAAYAAHGISGNVGWALAPLFVVAIASAASWRLALVAVAVLVLALLGLLWRQRHALGLAGVPAGTAPAHAAASPARAGRVGGSLDFLRMPAVWKCFAFFTIFAAALGGVQTFAPAAAAQLHGISAEQVALCLSLYMMASAAGMVLGGHLLRDPARSVAVAGAGFSLAGALALAIGLANWPPMAVPLLCGLMGLGSGIANPSRDLLVREATPAGATGRVYGVVYSGLDVGLMFAPLVFGALMDAGLWRAVWVVVALLFALLILTALNVRRSAREPTPQAAA